MAKKKKPQNLSSKFAKEKQKKNKESIYCPICKMHDSVDGYLIHPPLRFYIHKICGIVIMKPEEIKEIVNHRIEQEKTKKEEESKKVERQNEIKKVLKKQKENSDKKIAEVGI
jgi:hypothetical protein